MFKGSYHPKAFLIHKKNVKRGLDARTKIVSSLEVSSSDAKTLAEKTGIRYASVLYHLRLLETEHVVTRKIKKPYLRQLTGLGQQKLT
jgi:predicted ArsR family transcriptional regulator